MRGSGLTLCSSCRRVSCIVCREAGDVKIVIPLWVGRFQYWTKWVNGDSITHPGVAVDLLPQVCQNLDVWLHDMRIGLLNQ